MTSGLRYLGIYVSAKRKGRETRLRTMQETLRRTKYNTAKLVLKGFLFLGPKGRTPTSLRTCLILVPRAHAAVSAVAGTEPRTSHTTVTVTAVTGTRCIRMTTSLAADDCIPRKLLRCSRRVS